MWVPPSFTQSGLPPQFKSNQIELKGQDVLNSIICAINDSDECVQRLENMLGRFQFLLAKNRHGSATMVAASEKLGEGLNHAVNHLIDVIQAGHLGGKCVRNVAHSPFALAHYCVYVRCHG